MEEFIQDLHDARRRQGYTCRTLAQEAGVSAEVVSRLERAGKACVASVQSLARVLGFDLRLFRDGKLLMHGLADSAHIGEQACRYRREVLRLPRKAIKGVTVDVITALEFEPEAMPIADLERYARALGLTIGMTRRVDVLAN